MFEAGMSFRARAPGCYSAAALRPSPTSHIVACRVSVAGLNAGVGGRSGCCLRDAELQGAALSHPWRVTVEVNATALFRRAGRLAAARQSPAEAPARSADAHVASLAVARLAGSAAARSYARARPSGIDDEALGGGGTRRGLREHVAAVDLEANVGARRNPAPELDSGEAALARRTRRPVLAAAKLVARAPGADEPSGAFVAVRASLAIACGPGQNTLRRHGAGKVRRDAGARVGARRTTLTCLVVADACWAQAWSVRRSRDAAPAVEDRLVRWPWDAAPIRGAVRLARAAPECDRKYGAYVATAPCHIAFLRSHETRVKGG